MPPKHGPGWVFHPTVASGIDGSQRLVRLPDESAGRCRRGCVASANRRRFTKMLAFHGNPTAAVADVFHGGQLAPAHMRLVDLRRSAKRTLPAISAGIAEVAGFFGNGAALSTGISHCAPPVVIDVREWLCPGSGRAAHRLFSIGVRLLRPLSIWRSLPVRQGWPPFRPAWRGGLRSMPAGNAIAAELPGSRRLQSSVGRRLIIPRHFDMDGFRCKAPGAGTASGPPHSPPHWHQGTVDARRIIGQVSGKTRLDRGSCGVPR